MMTRADFSDDEGKAMITVMTRADYSDDECNMKRWSSAC